jgi:hypothetical protein
VTVCTYPNQKPWITGNIRIKLKTRAATFKERDTNLDTRIKIESYNSGSDACRIWQGLKTITDYKGKPRRKPPSDASLPDELNVFYARFEAINTKACTRDCVIMLLVADVSKTF